jgi:TRAP-type C4-dicarboxylate transport system substrate-binding protein
MKTRISNIVRETRVMDSKSYNELTPKIKEAVKEIYKIIENEQTDILKKFEGAVEKVVASYNIKKEDLDNYFDKEVNEQLGVK